MYGSQTTTQDGECQKLFHITEKKAVMVSNAVRKLINLSSNAIVPICSWTIERKRCGSIKMMNNDENFRRMFQKSARKIPFWVHFFSSFLALCESRSFSKTILGK